MQVSSATAHTAARPGSHDSLAARFVLPLIYLGYGGWELAQELYWRKSRASAAKAEQKVARLIRTGTLSVQLSLITQGSILPSYIYSMQ